MTGQPKLSESLRALRRRRGWTLQDVSERTGVAISTLSRVENDQMSLTYDKLLQISEGLDLTLAELLAPAPETVPSLTRRSVSLSGEGVPQPTPNYDYLYLCTDLVQRRMVPMIARARARSLEQFGPLVRHSGEEFIYVLAGAIEVHTEHYAPVRLEVGASTYIDSTMGHAYIAVGEGDATLLSVCSSPDPHLEQQLRALATV
jgi:transcriptional regulator with XRE-family HTH domain